METLVSDKSPKSKDPPTGASLNTGLSGSFTTASHKPTGHQILLSASHKSTESNQFGSFAGYMEDYASHLLIVDPSKFHNQDTLEEEQCVGYLQDLLTSSDNRDSVRFSQRMSYDLTYKIKTMTKLKKKLSNSLSEAKMRIERLTSKQPDLVLLGNQLATIADPNGYNRKD